VPAPEAGRQAAPLATMFSNVQDRVEHLQIRQADVAPLARQAVLYPFVLGCSDFHHRSLPLNQRSVNTT